MIVLGLDPGYEQSALVAWDGTIILEHGMHRNEALLHKFRALTHFDGSRLIIEQIESFGMAVGRTVFETVYWTGCFAEAFYPNYVARVTRREIKLHLCGHSRATDANIRQALLDRFGPSKDQAVGTKKAPGPLYGVKSHCWAALAVALTWWDQNQAERDGTLIRPGIVAEF